MTAITDPQDNSQPASNPVPPASAMPLPSGESNAEMPERQALIAEAAYLIAETRGFAPGHELDDWLSAEAEVALRISTNGL